MNTRFFSDIVFDFNVPVDVLRGTGMKIMFVLLEKLREKFHGENQNRGTQGNQVPWEPLIN